MTIDEVVEYLAIAVILGLCAWYAWRNLGRTTASGGCGCQGGCGKMGEKTGLSACQSSAAKNGKSPMDSDGENSEKKEAEKA